MEIFQIDSKSLVTLKPFLVNSILNPYSIYDVNQQSYANCALSELVDVASSGGFVLVAKEENEIVGLVSLKRSDWDTKHFGIEISKIGHLLATGDYLRSYSIKRRLVSALISKCERELLLHVSARVSKEDLSSIHALEDSRFKLMDVLVTYSVDLRKISPLSMEKKFNVRKFRSEEIPLLSQIALHCFQDSALATDRFHADPVLPKEKSGEVYSKWLISSSIDPSSDVLVAEIDGRPVGFNVCNVVGSLSDSIGLRLGNMVLTAVEPSARNQSVAISLLRASLDLFDGKVDVVESGGQVSNYAIQKAWNAVGLRIVRSQCTLTWSVLTETL